MITLKLMLGLGGVILDSIIVCGFHRDEEELDATDFVLKKLEFNQVDLN